MTTKALVKQHALSNKYKNIHMFGDRAVAIQRGSIILYTN